VGLAGALKLWHVTAIEDKVVGARQGIADVIGERRRDDDIAAAPDEQRLNLQ
jgi:hypothetical protein